MLDTINKQVALYARVSTHDQTPDNQLLDLRRYCNARGWTVAAEFVDHGISGAVSERPSLQRLMDAVRRQQVDGVLVWRFDRFARSVQHLVSALQQFHEHGVSFTSYQEGIDTSTAQGKMVFTFLAAIAEFELNLFSERIRAGHRRARASGKHIGRPPMPADLVAKIHALKHRSLREIAQAVGISKSAAQKILAVHKG